MAMGYSGSYEEFKKELDRQEADLLKRQQSIRPSKSSVSGGTYTITPGTMGWDTSYTQAYYSSPPSAQTSVKPTAKSVSDQQIDYDKGVEDGEKIGYAKALQDLKDGKIKL